MGEMSQQPPFDPLAPVQMVAHEPAADHAVSLQPAAAAPPLKLPAASVGEPVDAQKINVFFGIGAVVLLVATVAVVVLLAIFVLNLIKPR
jgi:hypothetical protein